MYGNKAEFLWFMAWSPRLLSPSWWTNQLLWKASVGNWGSSQQRVPSLGPMSGHLHPCSTPKCWSNFNVVSALGVAHPMSDELRGFAFLRTGRVWGTTMPQWLLPKSQPVQRHVVGVESWCLVLCSTRTWYWNHSQPDCLCLDSSPPMPFQPLKFRAIEALKPTLKCTDWHRLTTLMSMLGGQLTARVGYNNLRIGKQVNYIWRIWTTQEPTLLNWMQRQHIVLIEIPWVLYSWLMISGWYNSVVSGLVPKLPKLDVLEQPKWLPYDFREIGPT